MRSSRCGDLQTAKEIIRCKGHNLGVNSVAFSPDGTRFASGSDDNTIKLWDAGSGSEIMTLKGRHTDGINSVVFSPDGKRLASATALAWGEAV